MLSTLIFIKERRAPSISRFFSHVRPSARTSVRDLIVEDKYFRFCCTQRVFKERRAPSISRFFRTYVRTSVRDLIVQDKYLRFCCTQRLDFLYTFCIHSCPLFPYIFSKSALRLPKQSKKISEHFPELKLCQTLMTNISVSVAARDLIFCTRFVFIVGHYFK